MPPPCSYAASGLSCFCISRPVSQAGLYSVCLAQARTCKGGYGKPTSHSRSFQSTLSTLPQTSMRTLFKGRVQASYRPPVRPSGPPSSQGGSSFSAGPHDCDPGCGLTHSLPKEDLCPCNFPSPLPATQAPTSSFIFPSYSMSRVSFSQL